MDGSRSDDGGIRYGLIGRDDLPTAAKIFVRSFPRRVGSLFRKEDQAVAFYTTLFDLVRLAHGRMFLAAHLDGELVGYLALVERPSTLLRSSVRTGLLFRAALRAVLGTYGSPFRLLSRLVESGRQESDARIRELADSPHVYVIAVAPGMTGRGIGEGLLERARAACAGRHDRLWLRVENENAAAIRFYERIGFRTLSAGPAERVMVWELGAQG